MAVRGAEAKAKITKKILETFEGSFLCNGGKELRIPMMENGEIVQIKITLTAAKVNVSNGEDTVIPGVAVTPTSATVQSSELTEQEKKETLDLLASLNL
jgi:hypothetical protein